jgi:hypothetical protein
MRYEIFCVGLRARIEQAVQDRGLAEGEARSNAGANSKVRSTHPP